MPIEQVWYRHWRPPVWEAAYDALNWVALKLDWLTESIEGVPFLGEYLVIPFRGITALVWSILHGIVDVTWSWAITWNFIHGLVDGDVFHELMRRWRFDWESTRNKIYWYLWEFLEQFLDRAIELYVDLSSVVENALLSIVPELWLLFHDPRTWFLAMLAEHYPALYWFSIDPIAYITEEIYRLFPVTQYIFDDPRAWFAARLSDVFDVPTSFWHNPLRSIRMYIQGKLTDMIEAAKDDLYGVGEHLFRYFLEGVW